MLREIEAKQYQGEPVRRIFNSEVVNLTVWFTGNDINSFQIIHQYENTKYLLSWSIGKSVSCRNIDDGEDEPFRHKMTPIVTDSLAIDKNIISELLPLIKTGVKEIDSSISETLQNAHK